ncbi:MAG: ABC transporter permease [Coriobacteriales bacterium]|jgi:NitT/TauT family transport system permease protein|nr:ABC transporter permease [Coriobacteriales bacterium]
MAGNNKRRKPGLARALSIFESSIVIVVLLLAWTFIPLLPGVSLPRYFPSFLEILEAAGSMIERGVLWLDISTSLRIALTGLLLATATAIVLGLLLGWFARLERYVDPVLQVLRNTPVLAILPLFILILGIGDISRIAVVFFSSFFPTLLNTIQGVKHADPVLIRAAQSMGISKPALFAKVILPSATPYILAGFRLAAGVSLIVLVAAEMLGAAHGLGISIWTYQFSYQIAPMYADILTLAIIGVLMNFGLLKLEKLLTRWQEKPQ